MRHIYIAIYTHQGASTPISHFPLPSLSDSLECRVSLRVDRETGRHMPCVPGAWPKNAKTDLEKYADPLGPQPHLVVYVEHLSATE